jgi:hypothetical protein
MSDYHDQMTEEILFPSLNADDSFDYDEDYDDEDAWEDEDGDYDDSMDGDHASALASAGWGTDEDYGYYGEDDGGW